MKVSNFTSNHTAPTMGNVMPKTTSKKLFKPFRFFLGLLMVFSVQQMFAATITVSTSTNWTALTGGTGPGGLPSATDAVIVQSGATLTVNTATAVCLSISLGGAGTNNTTSILLFNAGSQVTVSGTVTLGGSGNRAGAVTMTSGGILICNGFALGAASGNFTSGTGKVQLNASNTLPTSVFTSFNDLTINAGTTTASAGLSIAGDLLITGTFAAGTSLTHNIQGDWVNNGSFTFATASTINFNGNNALQTISGTSTTTFNNLAVAKTSQANILNVTSTIALSAATNPLVISSGTFKLSSASTLTPFTSSTGATIPAAGGFWNNGGTINAGGFGWTLTTTALIRASAGTINIGNSTGNSLVYGTGSKITIDGGNVNIAGRLCPTTVGSSTTTYNQSAGVLTLGIFGSTSTTLALFDLGATGSSFTTSGGSIVIQATSSNAYDYLNLAATTSVTGGTVQFGNASTAGSPVLVINSAAPVYNLVVNATGTPNVQLGVNALTVVNDITIGSGAILNASSLGITIGGNWARNGGTFTPGTQTVTFNGTTQSIGGTAGTTFSSLALTGGTKTFAFATIVTSNLSIAASALVNPGTITTHTAGTLTLGGFGTTSGTFGSTSSAATRKNNTYFTAGTTGLITVGASTCSISLTGITVAPVCSGVTSYNIVYSGTTGAPDLYSISGTNITTVTGAPLPASPITISLVAGATAGTITPTSFTVNNTVTGCVSSNLGGAVTVNPTPTLAGTSSSVTAVCSGSTAQITVTGIVNVLQTISYNINGGATQTANVTGSGGSATFNTIALTTGNSGQTLTITNITAATCSLVPGGSNTATLPTVNTTPTLTGTSSSTTALCAGSSATITLSGLLNVAQTISYTVGGTAGTQTANVTGVSGSASFSTIALTAANSAQTLTITNIATATCSFVPSTNRTATMPTVNANGTWTGAFNTDWFNSANWCGGVPPIASTDVIIPAGGNQPTIGAAGALCNNISIAGTLTMNNTGTLSVSGNWSKSGTLTANAGSTVTFDGGTQTITGTAVIFNNLTINSTVSTTISIATNIAGILSVPATKTLNVGAIALTVNTGASATVDGTLRNNAGTITTTGPLTFTATGIYQHNFTTASGVVPVATWSTGSTCQVVGYTTFNGNPAGGPNADGGYGQVFSNFTWNCTGQTAASDISFGGNLTDINGNFTILSTGSGSLALGNTGAGDLTVGGNFSQSAGDFTISQTAARIMTVGGNFSLTGGSLDFSSTGTAGNTVSINVAGNYTHTAGTLTESGSATTTNIVFNKTGTQVFTSGGTVTNSVDYTVNSGSTLQMGTPAAPAVMASGTGGFFTLSPGATLAVTSGAGITSTGATGNIQVAGTRTYSTTANYQYIGSVVQATGSGLPATVNNLTIANTAGSTGVSLTAGTAVAGTLTLTSGNLTVGNNTLTLNGPYIAGTVNSLATTSGSSVVYNCTGTGPFTLPAFTAINNLTFNSTGQTYNLGSSPTVSGTLTLTNGIASIGSNTLTLNGAVARTAGFLAGSNTSNLTLAAVTGNLFFDQTGTNNTLKNFTLNTGATATLGNTLNITAYDGTSSEGVLTVTGTATLTTGGFLAIKSNANGTARIAPGRTSGGYISGNVSVERYIPQNSSKGWRLLASTTSGQNINAAWQEGQANAMSNPNPGFGTKITAGNTITTSTGTAQSAGFDTLSAGVSLFKYNATTDVLENVTATNTGNIATEPGYFLFIRGDRSPGQFGAGGPTTSTVLRSKGTLFLGDQTAVATGASNYALMRNPYPSRIDMRNIVRGTNLIDAYQVWDSKLGGAFGVGGFQTFAKSGANYVVSPGGGSYGANGSVNNFIESGAAFYIQSTTTTSNTAQVTEACKAASSTNNSYRPSDVLAEDKRLSFSLYAINPTSTDGVDGGLVFFNDTYSNSVDINDVRKSGNFSENFGIIRNNTDLVVERRKDVVTKDTIFFKMYQLRQISYRLDFGNIGFNPAVTTAVLIDKFTNTNTTLDLSTLASYTFTVSNVAGSFAQDRFKLVFTAGAGNIFSGTGNWTDNARWSKGTPAVAGDIVTIAAGANATLNTDFTVANTLSMEPTSTLVVNPTKTLSVSGTADLAGQSVLFKSDNTGYGSLGQVTGTLSGATNVTVERYIPDNGFRSWRLLSVPTFGNGQTIRQAWQEGNANPLPQQNAIANYGTQITGVFSTQAAAAAAGFDSTSVQAGLLTWNGTGWNNVTSTNTAIANTKAYFLFVRGDRSKGVTGSTTNSSATTLRTNGTVYTGNQVYNIPTAGFALVANTYPSAINFTGLTRSNVNNIFYVWDSKKLNGNSLGVYQTFSGTNSFNCLIGGGSYTLGQPNTIVESGQAFFVTGGNTQGGGTITLLEAAKVSGSNGNLGFRPAALPAKIDSRLLDANNEALDANVVVFNPAYNKSVDADDAIKFGNPGANFAIETGSKILSVEGTQPVADKDVVQFRMWNLRQQDYKLEFVAANMNAEGLYAIVEDSYLHTSKEINIKGITKINFAVTANTASSAPNRFRIVFSKNKPVVTDAIKPTYTIAPNPVEGKTVNLLFNNQPSGKYNIRIVGANGQSVTVKAINHLGGDSKQLIALPAGVSSGNYQIEIVAPDNTKTVKQLFVKSTL